MKNKSLVLTTAILVIATYSVAQVADKDGNIYKTVKGGTKEWMAENLNVTHFRNGDIIPEVKDSVAWMQAGKEGRPVWCYSNNDASSEKTYGKLYNWYAVNDPRGLAPDGWHILNDLEWTILITNIAGNEKKFNESGFVPLLGGYRDFYGKFRDIGFGEWWSSSEFNALVAISFLLDYGAGKIYRYDFYIKDEGLSVRCIRN